MGAGVAVGAGLAVGEDVGPEVAASLGVEVGVGLGVPSAPQASSTIPTIASEVTRAMSGMACNLRRGHREEPLSESPLGVPNSPISDHDFVDCTLQFTAAWQPRKLGDSSAASWRQRWGTNAAEECAQAFVYGFEKGIATAMLRPEWAQGFYLS